MVAACLAPPPDYNLRVGFRTTRATNVAGKGPAPADAAAGRILAIDYGRRRLGLAISDLAGWTARPLATVERQGRTTDFARLREIARLQGVTRILVGYPLRLDGTPGEMAEEAARFAKRIEQALALPTELVDERLTSWAARQWQADHGKAQGVRNKDEIAAAILLEDYLSRKPQGGG